MAVRKVQQEARSCLVKCLMCWHGSDGQTLSADRLRKIYDVVAPVPIAEYPPPTGLLPAGTPALLSTHSRADLNGWAGKLPGTKLPTGRYMASLLDGKTQEGPITVKAESVLPLDYDKHDDDRGGLEISG